MFLSNGPDIFVLLQPVNQVFLSGAPMVGGVLTTTVATLILLPILYTLVHSRGLPRADAPPDPELEGAPAPTTPEIGRDASVDSASATP